mmetsp:Transcript_23572/g.62074  ORF Transcript_23572/g.62074 Transcript_23572/m.62074 type:complete len:520 (-) Transcript_23572:265-1824(-)
MAHIGQAEHLGRHRAHVEHPKRDRRHERRVREAEEAPASTGGITGAVSSRWATLKDTFTAIRGGSLRNTFEERVVESICGKGAMPPLRRLAQLEVDLVDRIWGERPTENHLFIANLAMIVKQSSEEERYKNPIYTGTSSAFQDVDVFKKGARYVLHCGAAEGKSTHDVCRAVGLSPHEVLHAELTSTQVDLPNYYMCIDPVTDEIVLCIRGTADLSDVLTDLDATGTPFCGGTAHTGMHLCATAIVQQVGQKVVDLQKETGKRVAIVGHSLGAGTATLVMTQLGETLGMKNTLWSQRVKCWAFAPPPVFTPLSSLPRWVMTSTYSFVHYVDMVPRSCVYTAVQLILAAKEVDGMQDISSKERLDFLVGDEALDQRLPDYVDLTPELVEEFPPLNVVGTVLLLLPTEDGGTTCCQIHADQLHRILCDSEMLNCHFLSGYEGGYIKRLSDLASMDAPEGMVSSVIKAPKRFVTKMWAPDTEMKAGVPEYLPDADCGIAVGIKGKREEDLHAGELGATTEVA